MRDNKLHEVTDETVVRRMIAENPWATIVSSAGGELVASHYPILLEEEADRLTLVTHLGRPDEKILSIGSGEILVIVSGPHGYVSPSWYAPEDSQVPTWNFSTAHCYGIPEVLDAEENLAVLTRMVDHFERHVDSPVALDQEFGARLARGTVGLRIPIDRFICKVKMSQDKTVQSQQQVLEQLQGDGFYAQPFLAQEMQRALEERDA